MINDKAIPIYSVESITSFPLNPYKEFILYCVNKNLPFDFSMSLQDMYDSIDESDTYISKMNTAFKNIKLIIKKSFIRDSTFYYVEILYKGKKVGTMSYDTFNILDNSDNIKSTNREMTMSFKDFDGFDFIELPRDDNVFTFIKDDQNKDVCTTVFAILIGLDDILDFIRVYKAKMLKVKNIGMFVDKMIKPHTTNVQVVYLSNVFTIVVLCGIHILKYTCEYDNYLKFIKECEEDILVKYNDIYATK